MCFLDLEIFKFLYVLALQLHQWLPNLKCKGAIFEIELYFPDFVIFNANNNVSLSMHENIMWVCRGENGFGNSRSAELRFRKI
jgi:hypothetical protein